MRTSIIKQHFAIKKLYKYSMSNMTKSFSSVVLQDPFSNQLYNDKTLNDLII